MNKISSDFTMVEIHKNQIKRMISAVQFMLDTYQNFFAADESQAEC